MIGVLPRGVVLRYLTNVFMPLFVNTGQGRQARPLVDAFAIACATLGTVFGLGLWSLGQPFIALVFGQQFEPSQSLMAAVSLMTVAKLLFAIAALPALAWGETRLILIGSLGSLIGIAIGSLLLVQTGKLTLFVHAIALADVLALVAALAAGRTSLTIGPVALVAAAAPLATLAVLALASETVPALASWPARLGLAGALALIMAGCAAGLLVMAGSSPAALWRTLRAKPPPQQRPTDGALD
jgi:O-antigen/teichoic acid export membrane protein